MSAASSSPTATNPWIVALAVMTATFMEVLDTTVVNVSLPHIGGTLSATIDEATWVLTSYLVANAVVLPLAGWLARRYGRKRLLMTSVTGFTLSSLACGLAPNLATLIGFRVMQGATGGALQPLSQAVMLESFAPEDRGKAMGFWALGIVVAPILGPVLGGWLTDTYSWRWAFYINLPVGFLSIYMIRRFLEDPAYLKPTSMHIDYMGMGLLAVCMGATQILLDKGQQLDWFESRFIVALAIVAVLALLAFVVNELHVEHPVVDLRVFLVPSYTVGVTMSTLLGFALFGSLVLLPIMLQTLFGYPALEAGIAMAPRGLGSFVGMPAVGLLTSRIDPRKMVTVGLLLGSWTMAWLGQLDLNAGYWDIFWPQFLQGLALSLIFVPLTTISMSAIPRERMGNATSVSSVLRNIGGSVGIAVMGTLLLRRQQVHRTSFGEGVNAYDAPAQLFLERMAGGFAAAGADPYTAGQRATAAAAGLVAQQAAMLSFVQLFRLMAVIFLCMVPIVLFMRRPSAGRPAPVDAH